MPSAPSSERASLVRRIMELREQLEEADWPASTGASRPLAEERGGGLRADLSALHEAYAQGLPRVGLSRCPFTGAELRHSFDPYGLDGPWWDADWPIRPWDETPASLWVLSGAVQLADPCEPSPFLVLPGPQVPCVAPSLLEGPFTAAVVWSLAVGKHTAFPVAYFSDPPSEEVPTINSWGTRRWRDPSEDVAFELEIIEQEGALDPDLEPWIRRGKLLWIAPGDDSLTLHATVSGCPYLGLEGSSAPSRLFDGRPVDGAVE